MSETGTGAVTISMTGESQKLAGRGPSGTCPTDGQEILGVRISNPFAA